MHFTEFMFKCTSCNNPFGFKTKFKYHISQRCTEVPNSADIFIKD